MDKILLGLLAVLAVIFAVTLGKKKENFGVDDVKSAAVKAMNDVRLPECLGKGDSACAGSPHGPKCGLLGYCGN